MQYRTVNDFPITKELNHTLACMITARMAGLGIDISGENQDKIQEGFTQDLVTTVLDYILEWEESEPLPESKEQQEEKKTAEEILSHRPSIRIAPNEFYETMDALAAMHEYAEQSLSSLREKYIELDRSRDESHAEVVRLRKIELEINKELSSLRQQLKEKDELIKVQSEYISFLEDNNDADEIAFIHGFRYPQSIIDKGEEFRNKIKDLVASVPSPDSAEVATLRSSALTQIEQEEREFLAMMFGFCSARETVYPKAINRYDTVLNFIIKVKTDPLALADYETFLDPKSKIRIDTQTNYWKERLEQAENIIQKMGREGEINPKNSEDYDPKKPSFTIRKEGDPEPQKPEPRVGNL